MHKFKLYLGVFWASPITLLCFLCYVMPFWVFRWYRFVDWKDSAWVWCLNENAPAFIHDRWKHLAGICMGNIVVLRENPNISKQMNTVLAHELVHVKQCMILGIFQPIIYFLCFLSAKILQKTINDGNIDPYYDNTLEIHARRTSGQTVDMTSIIKSLSSKIKTNVN